LSKAILLTFFFRKKKQNKQRLRRPKCNVFAFLLLAIGK
jgi:hypothetical protein